MGRPSRSSSGSTTRPPSFTYDQRGGPAARTLGLRGYGFRALELLGFVGSGALIPYLLCRRPYCNACNVYLRTSLLAALPMGLARTLIGDSLPERQAERARLRESAQSGLTAILESSHKGPLAVAASVQTHGPLSRKKEVFKAAARIELILERCPSCGSGSLAADIVEQRVIGEVAQRRRLERHSVDPAVVQGLATNG